MTNTGVCDGAGCDFNSYRLGDTTCYGEGSGYTVDSTRRITVPTQFHATNCERARAHSALQMSPRPYHGHVPREDAASSPAPACDETQVC